MPLNPDAIYNEAAKGSPYGLLGRADIPESVKREAISVSHDIAAQTGWTLPQAFQYGLLGRPGPLLNLNDARVRYDPFQRQLAVVSPGDPEPGAPSMGADVDALSAAPGSWVVLLLVAVVLAAVLLGRR